MLLCALRQLPGWSTIGNGEQTLLQMATLRANVLRHADEAARHGVRLAIEPLNAIDNPGYLLPTPRAVLAFLQVLIIPMSACSTIFITPNAAKAN